MGNHPVVNHNILDGMGHRLKNLLLAGFLQSLSV
jgi:hypothetical protein